MRKRKKVKYDWDNYMWTHEKFRYSAAVRAISRRSMALFVLCEFVYLHKASSYRKDQDYIVFTYLKAKGMGIPHTTFKRVLRLLHKVGFIDVVFTTKGEKEGANRYRLSKRWMNYGRPDFDRREWPKGVDNSYRFNDDNGIKKTCQTGNIS